MEKITINKIIGTYPANYGASRVEFLTNEHGTKKISGFFKVSPQEGDVIEGMIATIEKDGKVYNNFRFPSKGGASNNAQAENQSKILIELGFIRKNQERIINHLSGAELLDNTHGGVPVSRG